MTQTKKNNSESLLNTINLEFKDYNLLIKNELNKWAIALIIVGIIHLVMSDYLLAIWGILLIILGILSYIIHKRIMFIVLGVCIISAGISNVILGWQNPSFWTSIGILQLFWGYKEIMKYYKYKPIGLGDQSTSDDNTLPEIQDEMIIEDCSSLTQTIEPISEENLEKLNFLVLRLKSLFNSSKAANDLALLVESMIQSKEDAINIIIEYHRKYNIDLVFQINKNTESYQRKTMLFDRFIEFGIVEPNFPHSYRVNVPYEN